MSSSSITTLKNNTLSATQLPKEAAKTTTPEVGKEEFLRMLVTQLENQDPMNPMNNTEFTAQLATFSSLEQLVQMNDKLGQLTSKEEENSSILDAGYVGYLGRQARAYSDELSIDGDTAAIPLSFTIPENAKALTISMVDAAGKSVRSQTLQAQLSGPHTLAFDVRGINPGTYGVTVSGTNMAGNELNGQVYQEGRVTGVATRQGKPMLTIAGVEVAASKVYEIKE